MAATHVFCGRFGFPVGRLLAAAVVVTERELLSEEKSSVPAAAARCVALTATATATAARLTAVGRQGQLPAVKSKLLALAISPAKAAAIRFFQ